MKRFQILCLVLASLASVSYAQSSSDNPLYLHIPADADKLYQVNLPGIMTKVDWKAFVANIPAKDKNKSVKDMLADPTVLGIDLTKNILITESNTLKTDSPHYTTVIFSLTDSGKFIRYIKENDKTADFEILPGRPRSAREGAETGMAWNDKLAVVCFASAHKTTTTIAAHAAATPPSHYYALLAARKSVATLRGSSHNPLLNDAFFRTGFAEDADFHSYSRLSPGLAFATTLMQMAHAPLDSNIFSAAQRMKNSHTRSLSTLRFENGRVSFHNKVIYDSIGKLEYTPRPLNTELIARLPQGNLLGMATLHLNTEDYLRLMQTMQGGKSLHMLDSILAKKGLNAKDLLSAFAGDLLIACIDNGKTPDPPTDSLGKPRLGKPDLYVVFTINNLAACNRVVTALKDAVKKSPVDSSKSTFGKIHFAHTLRDNIYVLGPDQQATDAYFEKAGRGESRLVTDAVSNNPIAVAVDLRALTAFLRPVLSASSKSQQAPAILDLFDQLTLATGRIQGNTMESNVELRMTDQQQNSLRTLMLLFAPGH